MEKLTRNDLLYLRDLAENEMIKYIHMKQDFYNHANYLIYSDLYNKLGNLLEQCEENNK
jgi:hypothetical protein